MNAEPIIQVGIALIFFGIAALTYQGVTHSIEIAQLRTGMGSQKTFPLPPLIVTVGIAVAGPGLN